MPIALPFRDVHRYCKSNGSRNKSAYRFEMCSQKPATHLQNCKVKKSGCVPNSPQNAAAIKQLPL